MGTDPLKFRQNSSRIFLSIIHNSLRVTSFQVSHFSNPMGSRCSVPKLGLAQESGRLLYPDFRTNGFYARGPRHQSLDMASLRPPINPSEALEGTSELGVRSTQRNSQTLIDPCCGVIRLRSVGDSGEHNATVLG